MERTPSTVRFRSFGSHTTPTDQDDLLSKLPNPEDSEVGRCVEVGVELCVA